MRAHAAACTSRILHDLGSDAWSTELQSIFFPLRVIPADGRFSADLGTWCYDDALLVHSRASPAKYLRLEKQKASEDLQVVVTFCVSTTLRLFNGEQEKFCRDGQFVLAPTGHRWNWEQLTEGEMWSMQVPVSLLNRRMSDIRRLEPYAFDATRGAGRLLLDMIRLVCSNADPLRPLNSRRLCTILADMLSTAIDEESQVLGAQAGMAQRGHLARIEQYVHANLRDPALCPTSIAKACGISTRYLHEIFNANGASVSRWILELRLQGARTVLMKNGRRQNICQVALAWGFADHAHFSRHFRVRFGCTPRDTAASAGLEFC